MISQSDHFPWYAIRVRSRHEKIVAVGLAGKGYSPFLPVYASRRRSSGAMPSKLPFFPGYVFCRFDSEKLLPVLMTSGVVSIVNDGSRPIPVDEKEIDAINRLVLSDLPPQACAYLAEGQSVRVEAGPLRGLEGSFVRDKNGAGIVVSISLLQRSIRVEIPREFVVAIRTGRK
jgi:transcription antitermination factor NusG